ncbi:MAG TPA: filamentous hemagglutinin N-terminal domain-containing protein, partial [Candidatus Obscuribacterales bacterium]
MRLMMFCGVILGAIATISNSAVAQIIPDTRLGNESSTVTQGVIKELPSAIIQGGAIRGSNLFHSFQEFNINSGQGAYFTSTPQIENILTRVTGNNPSNILGKLGVLGNANLFLMNPKGIIFGPNASLDLGGSFLATTASSIVFSDRTQFSATPEATPALLSVNLPVGLGFGSTPGSIINQSRASVSNIPTPVGLAVSPGKTLALIGGDVILNGGIVTAPGGKGELGSVQSQGEVSLNSNPQAWTIGYTDIKEFGHIQLSEAAEVNTTGDRGGEITVQARSLQLSDKSRLISLTQGSQDGGAIAINATDSVTITGNGNYAETLQQFASGNVGPSDLINGVYSLAFGTGAAGDIAINTSSFLAQNGVFLLASTFASGAGGNLTLNATNSVELRAASLFTGNAVGSSGDAGSLTIKTSFFKAEDIGLASTTNFGQGKAGSLNVNALELIELVGDNVIIFGGTRLIVTGLLTSASGTLKGGDLNVQTEKLIVRNGANIGSNTIGNGTGGNIKINATESTEIIGESPDRIFNSSITAYGANQGGNLQLTTGNLNIKDGGNISVGSQSNAGNLEIVADSINLDNTASILARSISGEGGNMRIGTSQLQMRHSSFISATAGLLGGKGNGGNININTDTLVGLEDSRIVANAFSGNGGNISITTQGRFLSPDSKITASSVLGVDGVV